jgi:predicted nucleic acid-binding Zn ribbon protein
VTGATTVPLMGMWTDRAACGSHDPSWWDEPDSRDPQQLAQLVAAELICRGCPVREQCHADTLAGGRVRRMSVMRAGILYDRDGNACTMPGASRCPNCGRTFVSARGRMYCRENCKTIANERGRRARRRLAHRTAMALLTPDDPRLPEETP